LPPARASTSSAKPGLLLTAASAAPTLNHRFAFVERGCPRPISTFDPETAGGGHHGVRRLRSFGKRAQRQLESAVDSAKSPARASARSASALARLQGESTTFGLCGGGAAANKYREQAQPFDCSETQACRYRIQTSAPTW